MAESSRSSYSGPTSPSIHSRKGSVNADTPWFLQLDHVEEVVYDPDALAIKQGSLTGLVEHLTRHDKLDASFNDAFLLTYPSFVGATALFDKLIERFHIAPPDDLSDAEMQQWVEQKRSMIRVRVVNILKNWFGRFWMEQNGEKTTGFVRHAQNVVQNNSAIMETLGASQLVAVMGQRLQDKSPKLLVPPQLAGNAPAPIVPKSMRKIKIIDIDATEVARQLTILEYKYYSRIKPAECLNKSWQRKSPDDPGTNVNAMILHSNQLASWVGGAILKHSEIKKRVMLIKHFINIADKCREMNNYATMMSIISGLGTTPIYRLYMTWPQINQRILNVLEDMKQLMASTKNFGKYRETLRLTNPPCVPFLGVYLTDLVFIEDGIPSNVGDGAINFSKRYKVADVLQDIQQFQNTPYVLHPVPELQTHITQQLQSAKDINEMYDRSLDLEPRHAGEELSGHVPYAATGSHMSSVVIASMAIR